MTRGPSVTSGDRSIPSWTIVVGIVLVFGLAVSGYFVLQSLETASRASAAAERVAAANADAVKPCALAAHPRLNVRCAVDDEFDARSDSRDRKEAAIAATAAAAASKLAAQTHSDTCIVLAGLGHSTDTDRLRADLGCGNSATVPGDPSTTTTTGSAVTQGSTPSPQPQPSSGSSPSAPSTSSFSPPHSSSAPARSPMSSATASSTTAGRSAPPEPDRSPASSPRSPSPSAPSSLSPDPTSSPTSSTCVGQLCIPVHLP